MHLATESLFLGIDSGIVCIEEVQGIKEVNGSAFIFAMFIKSFLSLIIMSGRATSLLFLTVWFLFDERLLFFWWCIKVLIQGIRRESLTHSRTIEDAVSAMVDEGGTIEPSFVRITEYAVNALGFEYLHQFVFVVSAFQCILQCLLCRLSEIALLDSLLGGNGLLLKSLIAY